VTVGRTAICTEAVALGVATTAGDTKIGTIVAVNAAGQVVFPCGMRCELIIDYTTSARLIVPAPR